jgi:hypothetical protein
VTRPPLPQNETQTENKIASASQNPSIRNVTSRNTKARAISSRWEELLT